MTSKIDFTVHEGTKLPPVAFGRSNLVSPVVSVRSPVASPQDIAAHWALDVRKRISESIECQENVSEEDIIALKKEVISMFIASLQHDSHFQWSVFVEILTLIEPYKEFFSYFDSEAELCHYLERVVYKLNLHKERLFGLQIEANLVKVFPQYMRQINVKAPKMIRNYTSKPVLSKVSRQPIESLQTRNQTALKSHLYPSKLLPDGTNPYTTHIPNNEEIVGARQITVRELSQSMSAVALEMTYRETVWGCPLGTTALALATVLPDSADDESNDVHRASPASIPQTVPLTSRSVKTPRPVPKMQEEVPVMNGREAVQFFSGCHHLGKIKSLFFNLVPSRHYSPYDLISVPKNKVNPEHFVFSTFGVLHVHPDQSSESLSLADWQQEAVLWKAVFSIPFFKNFLIVKAFYRWRANRRYTEFQRLQWRIKKSLLPAIPSCGSALLQMSKLLKELLTVPFLPVDTDKTFPLMDFQKCINSKTVQAETLLERFFKYRKLIVDFTVEGAFKKLHHCEEQVKKKTIFTKDSMFLQRKKKEERKNNLKNAKREAALLGNFVKLIDQMIMEHMLEISRTQVMNFVCDLLETGSNIQREGFFKADLAFSEVDILGLSPSKEYFQKVLSDSLMGIPGVLSSNIVCSDGYVTEDSQVESMEFHCEEHSCDQPIAESKRGAESDARYLLQDTHQNADTECITQVGDESTNGNKEDAELAGVTALDDFSLQDLPHQKTPRKEDDDLGIATPDLVVRYAGSSDLQVEGEGFMGQYSPLSKASLEEKLLVDKDYQATLKKLSDLVLAAFKDIDNYCEMNEWLNEIKQFCHKWTQSSVQEFRGAAAFAIEQRLTELRHWSDQVRSFDVSYVTENGLFFIDCSAIHKDLLPQVEGIYQELLSFVADEAQSLAQNFMDEMTTVLKNMKNKEPNVSSFAIFAKNFSDYKQSTLLFQQRVEYIRSLYEVIRMSARQLAPEEERTEETVMASWETFLMQMQDASEFVSTQTPLMTQQLEDTFQHLCKEAAVQAELAMSGQFLEPNENPLKVLTDMKLIRETFIHVKVQLQESSQWREAISGEPYNLSFLNEITSKMDTRQELWKYVETSTHIIKEWKKTSLKKINIKKALEKVTEWQLAANRLKSLLPVEDKVLTTWCKQILEFSKDLPILHKLTSNVLRERHWQAIFLAMNKPYVSNHQFTVAELVSCNLSDHADVIYATYKSAVAEYDFEQGLNRVISFWQDRQFRLAKHIPEGIFIKSKEPVRRIISSNKRLRKLERNHQERLAAARSAEQRCLDVANDDFFVLTDLEQLKYQLEDSRISVDAMLVSPFVEDIKDQVVFWCQAFREIEEITDLWIECQKKWLYLLKIFERPDLYCKLPQQAMRFEEVHNKFKDWMRVVSSDPRCLSVVSRRRGDRGYRLLQGDNLRSLLLFIIKEQEEILKDLEVLIERSRSNFPRLYFLSDLEIVDLLGVSRNLPALVPFVQKCFPGVLDLSFTLPTGSSRFNSQLDHMINTDKLEVVSARGACGEELLLYTRVKATSSATKWMNSFNETLKNTMTIAMRACVQARIEEGSRQPILILEELANLGRKSSNQEQAKTEAGITFEHWLLRFPMQCVIATEAIMWERGLSRALEKQDKDELIILRSNLHVKIDQLVDVMKEVQTHSQMASSDRQRIELLICGLLNQYIYHRDITDKLMESNQITDSAFDWLKILKFHMDIKNVLRAKTVVTDNVNTSNSTDLNSKRKTSRKISVSKNQKDVKAQDAPKLTRTLTTVSTDYLFSPCYVQQLDRVFYYDYEYLGPSKHLVVTPLTERAFLSMGHAVKTFHCGTMIGPSGTGKSETIKQLARLLGRCMFTISCHESISFSMMLQYLTGMVQSGCWALFDDTDRLTKGLLSVTGQQLDYLRTALRALDVGNENQYQIRGHSHFDKKSGVGERVIRRNSLTTLHPLPKVKVQTSPLLERQRTVPHGFNEKGLVTYFEETWVAERDQRRHSIEREIEINESDLYKSSRPPPLFYEHVKASKRHSPPDYSKLNAEPLYVNRMLGNVMLNGKLIQACSNFGCFMTLNANNPASEDIPYNFRVLMRPCALIVPDLECIISVTLQSFGFKEHKLWTKKLIFFFKYLETQMPKQQQHKSSLREIKRVLILAFGQRNDSLFRCKNASSDPDAGNDLHWQLRHTEETTQEAEEHSLVFALKEVFKHYYEKLTEETKFLHILHEVFPCAASQQARNEHSSAHQQLLMAITEVFKQDHLQSNDMIFNKILQLHSVLEKQTAVILLGPSSSGKTTMYHTLARAINMLNYKLHAPDHSTDDLTTERDFKQSKHKLKTAVATDELTENSLRSFADYPKIDVAHLFPCAMTPSEFLGTFKNGMWHSGILEKIVRDSYLIWHATKIVAEDKKNQDRKNAKIHDDLPSVLQRWLVLDGDLDPSWTEGMKTLLDDEKCFSLGNGERIYLKETTSLIFETCDLKTASPSIVSKCCVVHCGPSTMSWSALYFHWKQNHSNKWLLSPVGVMILDDLVSDVFPSTVKFLTSECQTALLTDVDKATVTANHVIPGVTEVSAFLRIFSAMLDKSSKRAHRDKTMKVENIGTRRDSELTSSSKGADSGFTTSSQTESVIPDWGDIIKGMFAFSYIWAFGGHLHDRFKEKFSKFAHDALYRARQSVRLPLSGLVFDYYLDESTAGFVRWSDRQHQSHVKNLGGFVVTPEVGRYIYLLDMLMTCHQPVLLTGAPGVGKTSLVQHIVMSKMPSTTVTMSRGLTPSILQDQLVSHVLGTQNKSNVTAGTSLTKQRHLFFIDDLSMAPAVGGYNPNLELIRCILTVGGIYDRQWKNFQMIKAASFIAAATFPSVPGSGLGNASHVVSSRLLRQFINLTVFTQSKDALQNLYSRPLQTWLEEFPIHAVEHHYEFAKAMSQALLELYQLVKTRLLPSPSLAQYIFSLHDVSRVVQGMLLMSPRSAMRKVTAKKKEVEPSNAVTMMKVIVQLWCHEVSRCFADRIVSIDDKNWFNQMVQNFVIKYFCSPRNEIGQELSYRLKEQPGNHPDDTEGVKELESSNVIEPQSTSERIESGESYSRSSLISVNNEQDEQDSLDVASTTHHRFDEVDSKNVEILTFPKSESISASDKITDSLNKNVTAAAFGTQRALDDTPGLWQQESYSSKLGVTFKATSVNDKGHMDFSGPLVPLCDIQNGDAQLSDIIFSKFYMAHHSESQELAAETGYTLQSEAVLAAALGNCLSNYNKETSQRLNLVFFTEAVHHAARLSRVLAYPKGHALLLGLSYATGRTTLARLAAFVAQCEMFEPKPQTLPTHNLSMVHKYIKLSSFHAGIHGKPTVLLVHEDMGEDCLQDISAIMTEGTVPGIYTEEDFQYISSQMMPGGVHTKRVDKIQLAFERFVRRIQQNLHVLVCLNYRGNKYSTNCQAFHHKLQRHPNLIKNSMSIDVYLPWSLRALSQVARVWLEDTTSGVIIPWSPHRKSEQIEMASNGMAYIHLSAKAAVEKQYCYQAEPLRMFTPLTYMEFVNLFMIVAAFLAQTEKAKGAKFEKALGKIDEAFGSIAEYRRKVSDLMPQSSSAGGVINDLVTQVDNLKENYKQALDKCKHQEQTIIQLQEPLGKLRKSAQTEFDKVNPMYRAATEVLDKLDSRAVDELRSYPSPPDSVKFVLKAICLLFGKPQTWEAAKSLMVDIGFFQELIFYQKDSIPEEMISELKIFVEDPLFMPENVAQASLAASSVCAWVHALYAYSSIHQTMQPHMKSLVDAENKLAKAQAQLGQLRLEAHQMKNNLEQYINQHKEAVTVAKAIEKQILAIERKIARANNLMENMSVQHFLWRSELKRTRKQIVSAPGDALITSAALMYHGPLDDKSRTDLLSDWLDHIKQNAFNAERIMDAELWSENANFKLLVTPSLQQSHKNYASKTNSGCHGDVSAYSEVNHQVPLHQRVKTFKYTSALYESRSYYKSELKRQDTMQTAVPEEFADDSDEDENCLLPTRPNLALQEILSDFDEFSEWRKQNLPTDLHSVHNALIMRVCCHNHKHCWPLLVDPDNQAEMWVRSLQNNQNYFTERDVASFHTDDAIPVEENSCQENEQILADSPPSRGTGLTFSDVTEYTATNTSMLRAITRQASQSCHSANDSELQTLPSETSESNSFNAESDIDFSKNSFWILMSDDPNFNSRLISAVVHGATVLVTHLERKPLDQLFRGLLLKQFYVDKDGNKIVKIGSMAFTFHPNFSLFLSMSMPLFVKGDGIFTFPLNHLCVINMTVSDEAIINRLMFETMKVEKKEFESQRRSNENDIILHRQQMAREHEIIREKTLNFPGPLLEDKTMLNSLMVCQTNMQHNCQILEETLYMGDHLEGKFSHYLPFIKHSTMLYCVLNKMSALHPDYYVPLYKFVEIFSAVVRSRDRGKESIGAPQMRAQELSDAVLEAVFKYVKLMMFEDHYNLLALLVSMERLFRQHQASSRELGLFVNGFIKNGFEDASLLGQKPQWMSNEAWVNCNILESLHQPFDGLCHSIVNSCQQWEEYFQNHVTLVSPVPGPALQELSLFQKCLLWKIVCPHKMAELSQALILSELGSAVKPPENYIIQEVYNLTDKHTPTVFILPAGQQNNAMDGTTGYPFTCPVSEVKQLAREIGMEGKVRILNFSVTSQMLEVKNAIKDCLHKGHWLLLHNYHLCQEPDPEFFSILKDIIYARWHEEDQNKDGSGTHGEGWSLVTRSQPSSSVSTNDIHQSFRLWITTRANEERALPGLIIQHGLRVTCEMTANFKNLLSKTYKSAETLMCTNSKNSEEMMHSFNKVMPLALLHAILLQQSYYGRHAFVHPPFWTLTDLAAVVDVCCNLTVLTPDNNAVADMAAWVYVEHCQGMSDVHSVNAIIKDLVHYSIFSKKTSLDELKGAGLLLHRLVASFRETGDLQKTLDSIGAFSAQTICLPDEIHEQLQACKSIILLKELIQASGDPERLLSTQNLSGDPVSCQAINVISSLLDILSACPELPETSLTQIMPLYAFFSQEVAAFRELLQSVQNDLYILNQAAHGRITLTPKMQSMFHNICNDDVPAIWLQTTFATCSSLKLWLSELPIRMNYVKACLVHCPVILSLNMFLRPDKLFWAIIQTFAVQNFKDITDISLEFQVMPQGQSPTLPPDRGAYIDGLQLKNASWNSMRSVLSENTLCSHKEHQFSVLWAKPYFIENSIRACDESFKNELYLCPAYGARDSCLHSDENIFWMIPLASLKSSTFWSQKKVAFNLSMINIKQ